MTEPHNLREEFKQQGAPADQGNRLTMVSIIVTQLHDMFFEVSPDIKAMYPDGSFYRVVLDIEEKLRCSTTTACSSNL